MTSRLRSDVRFRVVGGEAIVVLQSAAEVVVVNEVGARILELLAEERAFGAVLDALAEDFEAPRDLLERDTREFLAELEAAGIVEVEA